MSQQKEGCGAIFWGMILGYLLIILNGALFYLLAYARHDPESSPIISFLCQEDLQWIFLQDLVVLFLLFFFVGRWWGRATGKADPAITISLIGCLLSALSIYVLPIFLGSEKGGEEGLMLVGFIGTIWAVLVAVSQLVVGIGGGIFGGLIGKRLFRASNRYAPPTFTPQQRDT